MRKFRILLALGLCFCLAGAAFAVDVQDVYAKRGMVSSAHELASQAGVEILRQGGNAIDAAVATALALNVVEPNASGLGGGGFMVIRFAQTGEVVELDYREVAPNSATKDMYASEEAKKAGASKLGGTAVGRSRRGPRIVDGFGNLRYHELERSGGSGDPSRRRGLRAGGDAERHHHG